MPGEESERADRRCLERVEFAICVPNGLLAVWFALSSIREVLQIQMRCPSGCVRRRQAA